MQHSIRIDSFCEEDERFFGSYEAEHVDSEGSLILEFDAVGDRATTPEQLAHFTRFRKPVVWILAAMSLLSLVALAQQDFQRLSRREVAAHVGSGAGVMTTAPAKNVAAVSALPARSASANAAEQTSESLWSRSELAGSAIALVLERTRPSTSGGKLSSLADSPTQVSLVNDFTSALLSMCRNVPS